jgi:hypothetical protein
LATTAGAADRDPVAAAARTADTTTAALAAARGTADPFLFERRVAAERY